MAVMAVHYKQMLLCMVLRTCIWLKNSGLLYWTVREERESVDCGRSERARLYTCVATAGRATQRPSLLPYILFIIMQIRSPATVACRKMPI